MDGRRLRVKGQIRALPNTHKKHAYLRIHHREAAPRAQLTENIQVYTYCSICFPLMADHTISRYITLPSQCHLAAYGHIFSHL